MKHYVYQFHKLIELLKEETLFDKFPEVEPEDFIRCHQSGIKKINIATATFASVEKQVRNDYAENKIGGYYDLHQSEIQGAYNNAKAHMEIFYSVGKAE